MSPAPWLLLAAQPRPQVYRPRGGGRWRGGQHPRPPPGARPTLQTHSGSQTIATPVLPFWSVWTDSQTSWHFWACRAHPAAALVGTSRCTNFKPIIGTDQSLPPVQQLDFKQYWTIDKQTKIVSDVSRVWSYDGQLNPLTQGLSHKNHCTNKYDTDIQR